MVRRLILAAAALVPVVLLTPAGVLPLALMGWVLVVAVLVASGPRPDVSMPDPVSMVEDPHTVGL